MARVDPKLIATTPTMGEGFWHGAIFRKNFRIGILMLALLSSIALPLPLAWPEGKKPIVAIYSTFLQRGP